MKVSYKLDRKKEAKIMGFEDIVRFLVSVKLQNNTCINFSELIKAQYSNDLADLTGEEKHDTTGICVSHFIGFMSLILRHLYQS